MRYKLDGYFEYDGRKFACEYHGCNWHGCPTCFQSKRESTMNVVNLLHKGIEETELKVKRLKEMASFVIQKWSCEFQRKWKQMMKCQLWLKV